MLMTRNDWPGWSDWKPLLSKTLDEIPYGSGAYMVGAGGTIRRARHDDLEGILTIGKATSLRQRIACFLRCATQEDVFGHMAGVRFRELKMAPYFQLAKLQICWCETESPAEAAAQEALLLADYRQYHLENPPLNYNAPNARKRAKQLLSEPA